MQDIEFTVQEGTLYMLQTRTGKRTGTSAVRIAVEMVKEGKDSTNTRRSSGSSAEEAFRTLCFRHARDRAEVPQANGQAGGAGYLRQPGRGGGQGGAVGRGGRQRGRQRIPKSPSA